MSKDRRVRSASSWAVGCLLAAAALLAPGCGQSASHAGTAVSTAAPTGAASAPAVTQVAPPPPPPPHLVVSAPHRVSASWRVVARVLGQPAAWIARLAGTTLMRFDQHLVHLTLHAGSSDGGASGWTYGDRIGPREVHLLIAGFNGGFKLSYRNVGFLSGRHVAVPLKGGLASIVTYTDGTTNVGAWLAGVPSSRKTVFSVLQNQRLLIDGGVAAASVSSCIISCWGETIGSQTRVARSGLGIDRSGELVWAAGEQLLPSDLAAALTAAGALRAIELDINPFWVAGYLYVHRTGGPTPVPVVPGQHGIAGELLEPSSRDFLAIVAN